MAGTFIFNEHILKYHSLRCSGSIFVFAYLLTITVELRLTDITNITANCAFTKTCSFIFFLCVENYLSSPPSRHTAPQCVKFVKRKSAQLFP